MRHVETMTTVRQEVRGLKFTVAPPDPALAGVVERFFELRGTPAYGTHRLLPRPGQQLLINLADPLLGVNGATGARAHLRRHLLSGSRTGWFDSKPTGHVHFVGVVFAPMGLHTLLGIPQSELADRDLSLDEVMPAQEVELLLERLAEAPGTSERMAVLQHALLDILGSSAVGADNASLITRYALDNIGQPMQHLERNTGFSRQYLLRLLRDRTGLSLQEHQRLRRMNKVLDLLARPRMDLAEASFGAGFFDQAHFTRHFKRHTGLTPAAYLRTEREMGDPYFA